MINLNNLDDDNVTIKKKITKCLSHQNKFLSVLEVKNVFKFSPSKNKAFWSKQVQIQCLEIAIML